MNPMPFRVALFHPALIHGGIQRVFVNLARGFLGHGLAVDMVQATPDGNFRDQVPAGVRLVDLNATRALTSIIPLARYFRRERPDAMICGAVQTNVAAVWARWLARVPTRLILTEHNILSVVTANARMLGTKVAPFFVRHFYPWADDLVAVSQGVADDLVSFMNIPEGHIKVIYNPVVGQEFWRRAAEALTDPNFTGDPRPAILAVGRLHHHKDYPTLLRAMSIVKDRTNARLVFLGDGEERANLTSLTRQLGLEDRVTFLGDVANPLPYMKASSVLALSSIVEALPTVLIEALALGLPIVATNCPTGPSEILCRGLYGTLVPIGNSAGLADSLIREVTSSNRVSLSEETIERFQSKSIINQYLKLLRVADRRVSVSPSVPSLRENSASQSLNG